MNSYILSMPNIYMTLTLVCNTKKPTTVLHWEKGKMGSCSICQQKILRKPSGSDFLVHNSKSQQLTQNSQLVCDIIYN